MTFVLAHLSDPHVGPLPRPAWRQLANKRLTGYLNWRRRGRIHDMDVLGRLVDDMKARAPDHVAVTGDVLNIGLPAEFELARAFLETLGDPRDVSFTPGNHDAYVRGAMPHILSVFAPWSGDDVGPNAEYPYLRRRGDVALIGVSTGVPTAPLLASGRVGGPQRAALDALLAKTGEEDLFRVVMIHHPPYRGGSRMGRGLRDARQVEAIFARRGVELVLHGHNHVRAVHQLSSLKGSAPSVGVASASAVPGSAHHRAAYHLFTIGRNAHGWTLEGRGRGLIADGSIGDLGPLAL